jgi:putative FmdB family regulatory protein
MPNYEYVCIHCDNSVEVYFPITQKDQTVICENCGNKRNKVFGLGAVAFKGTGWGSDR